MALDNATVLENLKSQLKEVTGQLNTLKSNLQDHFQQMVSTTFTNFKKKKEEVN